jgi:hypothetical protein
MPSEVGGYLAQIANSKGLPRTSNAEDYRHIITQAANHLLLLAHPANEMCHVINSRRDAGSNINVSHDRRHEGEMRRQEDYDRDHGAPAHRHATRAKSTTSSMNCPVVGQSAWERRHDARCHSPPRDHH